VKVNANDSGPPKKGNDTRGAHALIQDRIKRGKKKKDRLKKIDEKGEGGN